MSTTCDNPYYDGPAHPGHRRCVHARRRIEAEVRQANVAPEKTKRSRKGVAAANTARRQRRKVVQGVPREASVQRSNDDAARQRIREKRERLGADVAVSEDGNGSR